MFYKVTVYVIKVTPCLQNGMCGSQKFPGNAINVSLLNYFQFGFSYIKVNLLICKKKTKDLHFEFEPVIRNFKNDAQSVNRLIKFTNICA